MEVPLLDLKKQWQCVREETVEAVLAVLDSQMVCNGPAVRVLESELAAYCDCAEAVGVSSGTDALLVSMMAMGVRAGDEVIVPTFTFFATAGCVWRLGATPVFVDVEPDTLNIDPARVAAAVTDKTKGIIPVHLYGQAAEMDPLLEIAERYDLFVLEDAAQSVGARYKDRVAGSMGTAGALSFYPTKNLNALGDAGMIVTNDTLLAERCRCIRNHGQGGTYYHEVVGGNFRMDSICAAGLSVKLKRLDAWSASRAANAERYNELLADVDEVTVPVLREYNRSVWNQYVVRAKRRDELASFLKDRGVGTKVYYPLSLHQQPCFAPLGYREGDLPVSEAASKEVIALPVVPELGEEQIQYVAEQIRAFYA